MSSYVPLQGGAYSNRSLFAAAQTCINLLPEVVPPNEGEPAPAVHQPTPGLRALGVYGTQPWRCMYRATTGQVYGVVGASVIQFGPNTTVIPLGVLPSATGRASMADNGVDLVVVDGSARGFHVVLASGAFSEILDPAFYGADVVACLDGFFVLNRPGTNQFYLSNNVAVAFNPLNIAAKTAKDRLISLAVVERELWLLGERVTEVWQTSGAPDFPLQVMSGGIEHGCAAAFSLAQPNAALFWLSQDRDGRATVMQGSRYQAARVSNHALEARWQGSGRLDDAVGWSYQIGGHPVYVLTFPSSDQTWCYDLSTGVWHQWSSSSAADPAANAGGVSAAPGLGGDAGLHRHRGTCQANAFGANLVGDWADGTLYALEAAALTDNGLPIRRVRAFPHIVEDADRVFHHRFVADMQTGLAAGPAPLSLRWSDDAGATWGQPVTADMGSAGAAATSLQFRRLGLARNRVYELSWDAPVPAVLAGAWIETSAARS